MLFFKKKKKSVDIDKYSVALDSSRKKFRSRLVELGKRYKNIDQHYFEELEEILIEADININLVLEIIEATKVECSSNKITDPSRINDIIVDKIFISYTKDDQISTMLNYDNPVNVYLIVGVNGVGKTTTIAKLAYYFQNLGKKVLLVAGDTFRAGAIDQLQIWADRLNIPLVKKEQGADPASVMYDGIKKAKEENFDIVLCDSAGRLQTKTNLMAELGKIARVLGKEIAGAPHETLLVIDGTTGQNGLSQAKIFTSTAPISGIILTKMDGTAKGGIVLSIKDELNIPVRFIGVGEKVEDLAEFDLETYLFSLFKGDKDAS